MNFVSIPNQKTYKQILEQIIAMIAGGELKSGDKLPGERALSEMLGTSRSSIREAFRTLEIIGVLEVRHGGGTFVRDFQIAPFINTIAPLFMKDVDLLGDMMDFRIMLESQAVRAAAKSADENTVSKMQAALEQMSSGNEPEAEQADIDFHMSIFKATGNKVFALAGECLAYVVFTSIHTSRTKLISDKAISKHWLSEHEQIFSAIKSSDEDGAEKALRRHLEGVRSYILKTTQEAKNEA